MLIKLHNLLDIIDNEETIIIKEMLTNCSTELYNGYNSELDYQQYANILDYYVYIIETYNDKIVIYIVNM